MFPWLFLLYILKLSQGSQFLMDYTTSVQQLMKMVHVFLFLFQRQLILFTLKKFIQAIIVCRLFNIWADNPLRSWLNLSEMVLGSTAFMWRVTPQVLQRVALLYLLTPQFPFRGSRGQCHDLNIDCLTLVIFLQIKIIETINW